MLVNRRFSDASLRHNARRAGAACQSLMQINNLTIVVNHIILIYSGICSTVKLASLFATHLSAPTLVGPLFSRLTRTSDGHGETRL